MAALPPKANWEELSATGSTEGLRLTSLTPQEASDVAESFLCKQLNNYILYLSRWFPRCRWSTLLYFHCLKSQDKQCYPKQYSLSWLGMLLQENVKYKPLQACATPAMGTNNVPTVCQVERGGGKKRERRLWREKQHQDKETMQNGEIEAGEERRT